MDYEEDPADLSYRSFGSCNGRVQVRVSTKDPGRDLIVIDGNTMTPAQVETELLCSASPTNGYRGRIIPLLLNLGRFLLNRPYLPHIQPLSDEQFQLEQRAIELLEDKRQELGAMVIEEVSAESLMRGNGSSVNLSRIRPIKTSSYDSVK